MAHRLLVDVSMWPRSTERVTTEIHRGSVTMGPPRLEGVGVTQLDSPDAIVEISVTALFPKNSKAAEAEERPGQADRRFRSDPRRHATAWSARSDIADG